MKFKVFLSGFLLLLPALVFGQGEIESCQASGPIVIDAKFDDWGELEWMTDQKGKFVYNICNDSANLYIRWKVIDDITQRKIGLFGLTVYLNPKGKKMGKVGVKFPVAKDMDELKKKTPEGNHSPAQIEQLKLDLVRNEEVLELVGLAKENIVSSRVGLMNGIQVIIQPDERGAFVYEAKIPFAAYHINKSTVKLLGVSIVTGKLVQKTQNTTAPVGGGPGNIGYANRYGMYNSMGYGMPRASSGPAYSEWSVSTSMSVGVKLK